MLGVIILWLVFAFLSFGILGMNYLYTKQAISKPWRIKINKNYNPQISIIVPTYNEEQVITYKIRNLLKLRYPKDLMQIIFIDSNSSDSTTTKIKEFVEKNPDINVKLLIEDQRRGKSSALNSALKHCDGDIIIVSDVDCFWTPTILNDVIPYLADPSIGAISGPKKLLNSGDSQVTKNEDSYLKTINLMKLGESKNSSTLLFEGGFSAYKRAALDSFDPYGTGSDDCGTVVGILEKNLRAIMVPEAKFFTVFPETWNEKLKIKIRRANQLIKVFKIYFSLLVKGKIKNAKGIIIKNIVIYLLSPFMFLFFVAFTIYLMLKMPPTVLLLLLFLIPKVRNYLIESVINYLVMLYSFMLYIFRKNFVSWKQPQSRTLLTERMLIEKGLI